MKMLQTQTHEFTACVNCLFKRIPVLSILVASFVGGLIFLFSIKSHILHSTSSKILSCFFSIPRKPNLLQQLSFYLQIAIPLFYSLRFISDHCVTEFLVVRLQSKWIFTSARLFSVFSILFASFVARLFALLVWQQFILAEKEFSIRLSIAYFTQRFLFELTLLFIVFFSSNWINYVVLFLTESFLIFLSVVTSLPNTFLFWVNGLNSSQISSHFILQESVLLILITLLSLLYAKNRFGRRGN